MYLLSIVLKDITLKTSLLRLKVPMSLSKKYRNIMVEKALNIGDDHVFLN